MENFKLKQVFADEGYCFTNRNEDEIYYICVWGTEEELKKLHQIPLERAKEIVDEYKRKFKIR